MKLKSLIEYLDSYLRIGEIRDASWNGLQFEGNDEVRKILFAVDAGIETFEKAIDEKCDMVVVHHGLFWAMNDPCITGATKKRIDILYRNDISLYACHLPLDRHQVVGNNVQLLNLIGARVAGEFLSRDGKNLSYHGEFKPEVSIDLVEKKLSEGLKTSCTVLPFGRSVIRTVGVISGGGGRGDFEHAVAKGLDLFITGEATDFYHAVKDTEMNVIFAGHHATEILGVMALRGVVEKELGIESIFIDIPTGL